MSRTLRKILESLNVEFKDVPYGTIDFPFNVEQFCIENDQMLQEILDSRSCGNCEWCAPCGGGVEDIKSNVIAYYGEKK